MKWVYNPRKLLAKLSAVPTLSLLAPMPWAVLCGMQWVGKLSHFTRTLSAVANHLHVCSQKGNCAAAAATGSQGKLKVAHCSHCAKVQTAAWLSSDVPWHLLQCCSLWWLIWEMSFHRRCPNVPTVKSHQSTQGQAAAGWAQSSPAIKPRSIWLINEYWVLLKFVAVLRNCVPYSWTSSGKWSDSVLQIIKLYPSMNQLWKEQFSCLHCFLVIHTHTFLVMARDHSIPEAVMLYFFFFPLEPFS